MSSSLSHLLREHDTAEFRRSLRDVLWYSGQVAAMSLAYHDRGRPFYLVIGALALGIAILNAAEVVKWWRIRRRRPVLDPRESHGAHAGAIHAPAHQRT